MSLRNDSITPPLPEVKKFDQYIDKISQAIERYINSLQSFKLEFHHDPEGRFFLLHDNEGNVIAECSRPQLIQAITMDTLRKQILIKMNNDEQISKKELELLLIVPYFRNNVEIINYEHVDKPKYKLI